MENLNHATAILFTPHLTLPHLTIRIPSDLQGFYYDIHKWRGSLHQRTSIQTFGFLALLGSERFNT